MTVKELMEKLAQFDGDMTVTIDQDEGPESAEYIEIYNNTVMIG